MKYNMLPILLASTFLSTSAVAQTVPTINTDYLNSLTGEKITWEVDDSEEGNQLPPKEVEYKEIK